MNKALFFVCLVALGSLPLLAKAVLRSPKDGAAQPRTRAITMPQVPGDTNAPAVIVQVIKPLNIVVPPTFARTNIGWDYWLPLPASNIVFVVSYRTNAVTQTNWLWFSNVVKPPMFYRWGPNESPHYFIVQASNTQTKMLSKPNLKVRLQ